MNNLYLQEAIKKKQSSEPYEAKYCDIKNVITDYDVFPYPRWYQAKALSIKPFAANRETGWRPRIYHKYPTKKDKRPNLCFQGACTLVKPCVQPCCLNLTYI